MGKQELTESELRLKISSYCAYQERSPKQVRAKLNELSQKPELINRVFDWAEEENFVSETRFAEAYAYGKFQLKKWGRFKIREGLRHHDIAEDIISMVLNNLEEDKYKDMLVALGSKKYKSEKSDSNKWQKTRQFLMGKGFELEMIDQLKEKIRNE